MRVTDDQFGAPSSWRFSDLGKCNRCQVLKRAGFVGGEHSSKTLFIFKMGHVIEDVALNWLAASDISIIARQVRVGFPRFDARGTIDALSIVGNDIVPIEVKSTRDQALSYRIPYRTHELQAGAYAWALSLPRSMLLYIGRDGAMAEVVVNVTTQLTNDIQRQWETLGLYWDSLPERHDGEADDAYYLRLDLAGALPPPPPLVPILDPAGNPELYSRAGAWGPAGTPKMKLDKSSCPYCMYPKMCCPEI